MKKLFYLLVALPLYSLSQQQTFDITSFTAPKSWEKQTTENTIQFSKEDAAKGTYCLITLYKSIPGKKNPKENFDLAWESLIKESFNVAVKPEMQPSSMENGWEANSGFAPFESEGNKGLALLITSSGFDKMVNIVILTNSDDYQTEMNTFLESVSFKKIANTTQQVNTNGANQVKPPQTTTVTKQDGFAFTTTNFDDGWTSTVQEDWVEVTKGDLKVLLHYPKEGTIFPADPEPLTNAAWNILVAPRYSNLINYRTAYINMYNRPYLGMGTATDNATKKQVYIVFFRQGASGWLEFISPDKKSFIRQYKFDPETIRWDSESSLMDVLSRMTSYNKFAVGAADFKGTWTSDFTGVQQLYHVYTGNYAGMNVNQSREEFSFGTGNTYNWKLLAVNGMVGNMKYAQVKSAGKFSVPNNWQMNCSDIEGKPKRYNAFFSCIKGARLLHLLDADYPGNGNYTVFGKK